MDKGLRFNICKLESASVLNSKVPNLRQKIETNIPASLQYGCIYWMDHLLDARDIYDVQEASVQSTVARLLCDIKALFWLEVLSLVQGLTKGLDTLRIISEIFKVNYLD